MIAHPEPLGEANVGAAPARPMLLKQAIDSRALAWH